MDSFSTIVIIASIWHKLPFTRSRVTIALKLCSQLPLVGVIRGVIIIKSCYCKWSRKLQHFQSRRTQRMFTVDRCDARILLSVKIPSIEAVVSY